MYLCYLECRQHMSGWRWWSSTSLSQGKSFSQGTTCRTMYKLSLSTEVCLSNIKTPRYANHLKLNRYYLHHVSEMVRSSNVCLKWSMKKFIWKTLFPFQHSTTDRLGNQGLVVPGTIPSQVRNVFNSPSLALLCGQHWVSWVKLKTWNPLWDDEGNYYYYYYYY